MHLPKPLPERAPELRPAHAARRRAMQVALALSGAALWPTHAAAQADAFSLAQLMQVLAQVKAGEARFTEKRFVNVLERTLESSGRLAFEAPDTFVRETLKPNRDKVTVVGNNMTMSMGSRSRSVALDSVPEASVIIEAIRGTLTGNRDALERHFQTAVSGNAQRWSLELVPRDWRLREQVASVRVGGAQAVVREVIVAMADGDRSVMSIEPMPVTPKPASAPGG